MLPLSLLRTAQGRPILIELKTGDTYNGMLSDCDNWMNLNLREVIHTSKDGTKFWKMDTCYVRGSQIKYLRVEEDTIDKVPQQSSYRGGRGGRGRGRGGSFRGRGRGRGRGGYNNRGGRGKFILE
jgi:U6 snRNA-associated Sm-like protein LSm4